MIVIRQAVPTDVETIAHFNISLCRETEGRPEFLALKSRLDLADERKLLKLVPDNF